MYARRCYVVNKVLIRYYLAMDILHTQQLLERVSSLLRSETRNLLLAHGLQPIQFEVLYYLSICNRYSDTPMSVTEYLGQTKGSVSQTLKVLEKNRFIVKSADAADKRVAHMAVTPAGRKLIEGVLPSPLLVSACKVLDQDGETTIEPSLYNLLRAMQYANDLKTFGQCSTCRHNIKSSANRYLCGLTNEALTSKEVLLICREHEPGNSSQGDGRKLTG